MGEPVDHGRELRLTAVALAITSGLAGVVLVLMASALWGDIGGGHFERSVAAAISDAAVLALVYGGLAYHWARWGCHSRQATAQSGEREDSDSDGLFHPDADAGLLTVLIPSYCEGLEVVRQTALSAALQDFPDRRVVILVDDPPVPEDPAQEAALQAVRMLPRLIEELLAGPAQAMAAEERAFLARTDGGVLTSEALRTEAARIRRLYREAGRWFDERAAEEPTDDHTARLFTELTFRARGRSCRDRAAQLIEDGAEGAPGYDRLRLEHRRLSRMFAVQVSTFERKRFVNLPHAANKAMNLNAYIALLGRRWSRVGRPDGTHLEPATWTSPPGTAAAAAGNVIDVPATPWLLTLDADSVLAHDYAVRLVTAMGRPEHARVAVMQTPYSSVPGATSAVERAAGATTDIMHMVHQGTTRFNATYWVGANALVRTAALDDIAVAGVEDGKLVRRFIQDRTVIEDTESTVDLIDAGWRLHNYPARLAYSATPADYGSLLIQRRRWANGGLIILPKLIRSLWRTGLRGRTSEALLRIHYLVSIAIANVALIILTLLPFAAPVPVALLVATCVSYFALYARDLRLEGRPRGALLEVYALNLLLLPVNLGGVAMSLRQGLTGRRIPFCRTPKVADRTAAPALYMVLTMALLAAWTSGTVANAMNGHFLHAALGAVNAAVLAIAVTRFIGWRHALTDLAAPLTQARGRLAALMA